MKRKGLEFVTSLFLTLFSFGITGYIFPISENGIPMVVFIAFLFGLSILFMYRQAKSIGFGILTGLGVIVAMAVFVLIMVSQLH